ncbi:recombinase family protein [Siansivirga zeaxanthinifaciens]|uniref:recombinase family protein n=1 Tax=Siansivirga zeaxanthinifaciens TaxID=762954 RepID=UPI000A04C7A3|nr:recombinase family protein [Siansivirga zeaxanthinifaciens]
MNTLEKFKQFAPKQHLLGHSKNAIIYTRVSTKEQADTNTSLETQKKYCEHYAKSNGYNIVGYFGGTYESAKSDERKEFKRMLKHVRQSGSVGYIIVYSYDRFSRTGSSAAHISQELFERGIQVKAVTQEVDTTSAAGKFQQNMFFMFSQFDNELRRDKTITAMTDLLRKGYWLWSPPIGYVNKKKYHKAVDWEIVPSKKGKLLKKAFAWKTKGIYTNVEIIDKLKGLGMAINERRLSEVFKNPFYCGVLISKMVPGEIIEGRHEPLVSKENFLKINSVETHHPKHHKSENDKLPLKQFIYCERCKLPLTGYLVKKKGLYYYKCRTKGCSCNKSAKALHKSFEDNLNLYQVDPKYNAIIKEVMAYSYDNITKEIRQQSVAIKKKITELNDKIESVEERFALGEIDSDIYKKFKDKYDGQRVELQSKMENPAINSSNLEKAIEKALELSASLQYIWVNGDLKQKQRLQNLVFPGGLGYDKSNDRVRTPKVNAIFSAIHSLSGKIERIKKGEPIPVNQFSDLVTAKGFEPPTLRAEI